jgi:tetratricopeptide (TPR) repeat protein
LKIKTPYIYLLALIILIAGLITLSRIQKQTKNEEKTLNQMPDDDIHKNLKNHLGMMELNEETKKVIEEYENALKTNPNDTLKMREYAEFLAMSHKIDQAQELYEKIYKIDNKRKDVLLALTTIYFNKGELDKATDFSNKILMLDKNDLYAIYNLGVIEATKENFDIAQKHWENILKESPDSEIGILAKKSIEKIKEMRRN